MKTIVDNNDNSNNTNGALYPSGGPGRELKAGLASKKLMLGAMINEYARPSLAKIYKEAGYDFLFIDYEHLFFDFESLYDMLKKNKKQIIQLYKIRCFYFCKIVFG